MSTLKEVSEIYQIKKETIRSRLKKIKSENPKEEIYKIEGNTKQWNITPRGLELLEESFKDTPVKHYSDSKEKENINFLGYLKKEVEKTRKKLEKKREQVKELEIKVINLENTNKNLLAENEKLQRERVQLSNQVDNLIEALKNNQEITKLSNRVNLLENNAIQPPAVIDVESEIIEPENEPVKKNV